MSRMVLNGVVLASLIAGSSFSSPASAATPTITSAQLTDSTVVISGANFDLNGQDAIWANDMNPNLGNSWWLSNAGCTAGESVVGLEVNSNWVRLFPVQLAQLSRGEGSSAGAGSG